MNIVKEPFKLSPIHICLSLFLNFIFRVYLFINQLLAAMTEIHPKTGGLAFEEEKTNW